MGEYYKYPTIPVGQQQHCLCFVVVVLVVRQEWGNIGVGPVAGETRADSIVEVQVGIVGVQVGNLPERERFQTSPKSAHLMNYYFKRSSIQCKS